MPLIIIIIIINTIAFNYRSLYDTKRDDKVRLGLRSNARGGGVFRDGDFQCFSYMSGGREQMWHDLDTAMRGRVGEVGAMRL